MAGIAIVETIEAGVATLRLASPERGNAFQPGDMALLADAITAAATREGVRALVLTGTGRVFSAGADLGDLEGFDAGAMAETVAQQTGALAESFRACPVPTIAAVNGAAAGAATGVAMWADIAIAARSARFLFPFASLGLVPDTGIATALALRIGAGRARSVLMRGGMIGAEDALTLGLIAELHDDDALPGAAQALAATLGAMPAGTHAAIRALLIDRIPDAVQLRAEADAQAGRLAHAETVAAISRAMSRLRGQ